MSPPEYQKKLQEISDRISKAPSDGALITLELTSEEGEVLKDLIAMGVGLSKYSDSMGFHEVDSESNEDDLV